MAVTTIPVDVGTTPGDGTGDPARTGGQSINTSVANLDAAVELLQSGGWTIDNTSESLAYGERCISTTHAGITKTLPAAQALSATAPNTIWIVNTDTNSNITIAAAGTESLQVNLATITTPATYALQPGYMAIAVYRTTSTIELLVIPISSMTLAALSNVNTTGVGTGDLLVFDGSNWVDNTLEAADIVARSAPALEATPYLFHQDLGTKTSGTETIDITTTPSAYLKIGGNNVTIHLDVPALSLPVRGLAGVKTQGLVRVHMNGAYTGLTVTTDAGDKNSPFPKGTAPTASGEEATLVWYWHDDGTSDFLWAEWANEA